MLTESTAEWVLSHYDNLNSVDRYHMGGRLLRCQFDEIANKLPDTGTVVDIGCGHGQFGIYLSQQKPDLSYIGCDPDENKISKAQNIKPIDSIKYYNKSYSDIPDLPNPLSGVTLVDVLYLMPIEMQKSILSWVHDKLRPGGVLVIKSANMKPGLKLLKAYLQEFVMIKVLKRTRSSGKIFSGASAKHYRELLESMGFSVDVTILKGNKTPAFLLEAVKN